MDKLQKTIDYLRNQGRFGDTDLVHVNAEEKAMLKAMGGSGTINPNTGLEEYFKLSSLNPVKAIKKVGSIVDDVVHDVVPGGWKGAALITAAVLSANPELAAAAESGDVAAQESLMALNDAATTQAATETAGATAETSPWSLTPSTSTGAVTANTIPNPYVLSEGTAGLTAEQVANAANSAAVGSNAASGLGYLGGAESLPAGTAGISGVTAPSALSASDMYKTYNALTGAGQQIAKALNPSYGIGEMYQMKNPFYTPKEEKVLANTTNTNPVYLGQLANLLRG